MSQRRCGRFASTCALEDKHMEWNIPPDHKLISMKYILSEDLDRVVNVANFSITPRQKKERKLLFCEGCLNHVPQTEETIPQQEASSDHLSTETTDLQDDYENFQMESDVSLDSSPSMQFKNASCQTENIIVDLSVPDIDVSALSSSQRQALAHSLAAAERKNIEKQACETSDKYKDLSFLRTFDVDNYLSLQNPVVRSFISGLRCTSSVEANTYRIARTIEEVTDTCNPGKIMPIHFMESLVLYCMTQSKMGVEMISSQTPYPCYKTMKRWLQLLQNKSTPQHPLTSCIYAIDNNQILQRKWCIKVDNKCYSSVTTMVVAFDLQENDVIRKKQNAPPSWRNFERLTTDDIEKIKHIEKDENYKSVHYGMSLVPYLTTRLAKVIKEQENVDGQWQDDVDKEVASRERRENMKICGKCGHANPKKKRTCSVCSINLAQARSSEKILPQTEAVRKTSERRVTVTESEHGLKFDVKKEVQTRKEYEHIPIDTDRKCPKVFVLHPSMHNPNSYDAIRSILLDVGKQAGIKKYVPEEENQLAVIFCDGVPYNLIWRLCECTYRCLECNMLLKTSVERQNHEHDRSTKEFDWVVVLPGPGHIEMNMLKSLVLLLWPVFWKEMVTLFNFTSESALRSARAVSDHHKGWATLSICRNALFDELLVPFVRKELGRIRDNVDVTDSTLLAKDYFKYLDSAPVRNPNYLFLVDVAFELMDAIFLYRGGIRSGNAEMAWAARAKFAKVWTGRNHPSYRELNTHDFIQNMMMPEELREFTDKAMSLNITGVPYTAEGPDFRLEEVNRNVQSFLPLSPKDEDWQRVCANFDTLNELRSAVLVMKGTSAAENIFQPKQAKPAPQEELAVRVMFRRKEYLLHPEQDTEHVSVTGEKLSSDLVNFCTLAATNHAKFVEDSVLHNKTTLKDKPAAVKTKIGSVSITEEEVKERSKLEKQTTASLSVMVQSLLTSIEEVASRERWTEKWTAVVKRRPSKREYVLFYEELLLFIGELEKSD